MDLSVGEIPCRCLLLLDAIGARSEVCDANGSICACGELDRLDALFEKMARLNEGTVFNDSIGAATGLDIDVSGRGAVDEDGVEAGRDARACEHGLPLIMGEWNRFDVSILRVACWEQCRLRCIHCADRHGPHAVLGIVAKLILRPPELEDSTR